MSIMKNNSVAILLVLLLAFCGNASGQLTPSQLWKKDVLRIIKSDTFAHNSKLNLFDILKTDIRNGALTGFSSFDYSHPLLDTLSQKEINDILGPRYDTIITIDTEPGKPREITTVHKWLLLRDSIYQYRSFESWAFDPSTLQTRIDINGIGPVWNVYGADHEFRGRQTLFWVKFNELNKLLQAKQLRALSEFTSLRWADFFKVDTAETQHKTQPPFHVHAIRTISLYENEDTVRHHLEPLWADSLLSEMLIGSIQSGLVIAWNSSDTKMQTQLPTEELTKMVTITTDTGRGCSSPICRSFDFHSIIEYEILEDWVFETITGQIETNVIAIAPIQHIPRGVFDYEGTRTMCWLHYEDIKNIIHRYDQYHPTNTFSQQIWNSYFFSDEKPVIVK